MARCRAAPHPMGTRCRIYNHGLFAGRASGSWILFDDQDASYGSHERADLMLQLERITLREIRLPLKEPFRISSGVVSERRICLLELVDADGTTGWSECVAGEKPNYSYETIDTAWLAMREW